MGRGSIVLIVACVVAVFGVVEIAALLKFDIRNQVAPALTAAGVAGAAVIYFLKEAADRRRKTLETFEKLLYDRDLRLAWSSVETTVKQGTYESDDEPDSVGSIRDQTSLLLNYLDVTCAGVRKRLYDRTLFREFMSPLAQTMVEGFLVRPRRGELPSELFLKHRAELTNIEAVFPDLFAIAAKKESTYRRHATADTKPHVPSAPEKPG